MLNKHKALIALIAAILVVAAVGYATRNSGTDGKRRSTVSTREESKPAKPERKRVKARGLYMTGWTVGVSRFDKLVKLIQETDLNAVVIDVKDDGAVSYDTEVPLEREIGASRRMFKDPEKLLKDLDDKNIYTIARIVCFRDSILPKARPDLAIQTASGQPWKDRAGYMWLNPYKRETWDYNVDIAIDAAKKGFKEIQYDYVRFPSEGHGTRVVPSKTEQSPDEIISAFLGYAREKLKPYDVWLSVDIFGLTGLVDHDMGIGQIIHSIAENVDYICPMTYPSHYNPGEYGIANPNKAPYDIVFRSVRDAAKRIDGTGAMVRPWLQDFSLYGVTYGAGEVRAQIKAAEAAGISEYLFWNPRNRYTAGAYSGLDKLREAAQQTAEAQSLRKAAETTEGSSKKRQPGQGG